MSGRRKEGEKRGKEGVREGRKRERRWGKK